jgi:hypothetical protein
MKQIFTFLILPCLILFSCQNKTQENYTNEFGSCLNNADKKAINKLTGHFEILLKESYPDIEISLAYQKYLEAISKMEIQPDFLLDDESLTLIKSIKETNTFSKIWTKLEIEPFENSESEQIVFIGKDKPEEEPKSESLCINPNGDFLVCLINKVENKDFKEILETKKEMPDISNGLVASAMHNSLQKDDYENGLIRVFIVLNLYYEYTLNLEKLKISG